MPTRPRSVLPSILLVASLLAGVGGTIPAVVAEDAPPPKAPEPPPKAPEPPPKAPEPPAMETPPPAMGETPPAMDEPPAMDAPPAMAEPPAMETPPAMAEPPAMAPDAAAMDAPPPAMAEAPAMAEPPPPPPADAGPVSPTGRPGLPLRYRTPDEVKAALDAIAARPAWGARKARVERYGTSAGGRPLWVLRIGPDAAPQVLVHGGLGARDAAGTVAAIAFADATLPDVTPAEGGAAPPPPDDRVGWLVIPAPNPDALAAFLEGKPRLGGPDVDRDQDGRAGEDGPDDLDGDGEVVSMRRRAPDGPFVADDAPPKDGKALGDPRAMKEAGTDARRAASFTRPVEEGKDDDGDGDVNEDPPGTDLARNLMGVWEEMGAWPGDGPFPGSAPEAKALLDLSWDTPALVGWYAFTSEGARLERASERGNDADADDALYGRLAGPWREAAGGVELRKASERPGASENRGSDLDWAARHLGVPALRVPVWRIAKEAGSARDRHDPDEVDWLLWNDRVLGGKGFVPWHEVAHPQLGTVEVGGWKRFTRWEPPADLLPEAVRRVMRVPSVHAAFAPRLAVRVEVTARGARDAGAARLRAGRGRRGARGPEVGGARHAPRGGRLGADRVARPARGARPARRRHRHAPRRGRRDRRREAAVSRVRRRAALVVAALAAALSPARPAAAEDPSRPLVGITFDRYYDGAALESALKTIHASFPLFTRLESMGASREGRPLWVISVFDPSGPRAIDDRPAMYIDGNTHGNEVQCTEVALFTVKYLLERKDADPWIGALLKRVTFHVAPCVNPDARERFLHQPNDEHSPRRVLRPVDDDRDGRVDEDGPDDVDGDGDILTMRIADPNGDLVDDERDARLMRPAKPGEKGRWRILGAEGTDEDGDGRVNEDGPGGVDPNRNFPCEWRPDAVQGGGGPYPLSEPETRATALWVLAHPRIAAVQSYHNAGRMILRPPAARTDREADFPAEDKRLYDELASRGQLLLPGYRYMQIREELYQVWGGFVEWTAHALGVPSFTNELWGLFGWGTSVVGGDLEALRWNDVALHGAGFVRWKKVKHPTYGEVELGGWRRYTIRSTPVDFLPDLCVRNCLFTLEHASAVPDLDVRVVEQAPAGGARRVRVVVENRSMMPTATAWARRHGLVPPDLVGLDGAAVLAAVEVPGPGQPGVPLPVKEGRARLVDGVGGASSRTLDLWVDAASKPTAVVVSSRLGGLLRVAVP